MYWLKNIISGFLRGLWGSFKGIPLIFSIDTYKAKRAAEQQKNGNYSSVPCAPARIFTEDLLREPSNIQKQMTDERSLESLQKKYKPSEPALPLKDRKILLSLLKWWAIHGFILIINLLIKNFLYFYINSTIFVILKTIISVLLFVIWKFVSCLYFNDIAIDAYKVRKGQPTLIPKFNELLADFAYTALHGSIIFLLQVQLVKLINFAYVGTVVSYITLCLLNSTYSFEYKWFNMGWGLERRLTYIEVNWPYFMGFGLPLTFFTSLSNSIVDSNCIFAILFPLCIFSANETTVITGTTDKRLRIFWPSIFLSNLFFRISKVITQTANKLTQQRPTDFQQQHHNVNKDIELQSQNSNEGSRTKTKPAHHRCCHQSSLQTSPAGMTSERNFCSGSLRSKMRHNPGCQETLIRNRCCEKKN